MPDFRQRALTLADKARALHASERCITLASVELVGEILMANVGGYLLLGTKELAGRIGLTHDQFLKRSQAARVLQRFPQVRPLLEAGRVTVSQLAIIAPMVTEANVAYLLAHVEGKTSAEVRELAKRVGCDGVVQKPRAGGGASSRDLLDRAVRAAAARGRRLSREQIMREALELWLDEWEVEAPQDDGLDGGAALEHGPVWERNSPDGGAALEQGPALERDGVDAAAALEHGPARKRSGSDGGAALEHGPAREFGGVNGAAALEHGPVSVRDGLDGGAALEQRPGPRRSIIGFSVVPELCSAARSDLGLPFDWWVSLIAPSLIAERRAHEAG